MASSSLTGAEQLLLGTYPFMSKKTFDQVLTVMWGRNDYDYHTQYINSRTEWFDEDIVEEAMYATGLAYGLRLAASHRDQSSALPSQSARPVLSFEGVARAPSALAALQRQASMVNDKSAPRQDSRDYPSSNFETEHPYAKTSSSSSPVTPRGMAPQPSYTLPTETEVPGIKLTGDLKAVNRPGQAVVAVSGAPISPNGRSARPSPSDSPESRLPAEIPQHQKLQFPAAFLNDNIVRYTTVGSPSGFELDGVCAYTPIQSSETESSKPQDSETDNEDWVDLGMN